MNILITGSEGVIGKVIKEDLSKDHNLTLLDQEKSDDLRTVQADICDLHEILPHFKGIETIIHLAADVRNYINWVSLVNPNLTGTRNVYEAASQHGVERVIYASSLNVYPWSEIFRTGDQITSDTLTSSSNDYGLLKILSEEVGRDYYRRDGISVVNLRLGSVNVDDMPCGYANEKAKEVDFSHWLSKRDVAGIVKASLNYKGFVSIPCCSSNNPGLVDLSYLKSELGYVPQDSSEKFTGNGG